jgi:hypothetical protein
MHVYAGMSIKEMKCHILYIYELSSSLQFSLERMLLTGILCVKHSIENFMKMSVWPLTTFTVQCYEIEVKFLEYLF